VSSITPDLDQRILALRPDLGEIEGVCAGVSSPCASVITWMKSAQRGKIAAIDRGSAGSRPLLSRSLATTAAASVVGQVLDPLLGAEMEFDPDALIGRVDHREGCGCRRGALWRKLFGMPRVGHHDRHLVQRFGQQGPEIPVCCRRCAGRCAGSRLIAWLRSGKAQRIAGRRTPVLLLPTMSQVAFLGVELHPRCRGCHAPRPPAPRSARDTGEAQ